MAILGVVKYGDDRLRQISQRVPEITDTLRQLLDDMAETMFIARGVGLAGVQVGVLQRLLIIDANAGQENAQPKPMAFINPEIIEHSDETNTYEEGCLSIPGCSAVVRRPSLIRVKAISRDGNPFLLEATEVQSRILQHEIDHLEGILFVDRLSPLKRDMTRRKLRKRVLAGEFAEVEP